MAATDRFNRQLHPDERASIARRKEDYAKRNGLTVAQAEQELLTQANLMVQNGSPGQWNERAARFLREHQGLLPADGNSGTGYMFHATREQRADPQMYAKYYVDGVWLNQPSSRDLANAVNREDAYQDVYTKGTLGAAVGAATVAFAGPVAVIPGAPIFSSSGVLGSGALASPVGTGTISATINAGAQYLQNGSINPVDVGGAFVTGALGSKGRLLWNMGVNAVGGATTTVLNNVLQGKSDSIMGAGVSSGVLSGFGYGAGKIMEGGINSAIRPSINSSNSWAGSGVWSSAGYNLLAPNSSAAIGATFGGGIVQEILQNSIPSGPAKGGEK
jgi:filamentous hemagglutinin